MVSIRDSLTELERMHAIQAAVLENYVAALRDMEQYAVEIDDTITPAHRRHLAALAADLTIEAGTEKLAANRTVLRSELRDYRDRAAAVLSALRRDLTEKVEALQAIVEAMASADGDHEVRLKSAMLKLRKVTDMPVASPVRAALLEASGLIEASIEEIRRQNSLTVGQLMVEIKTLHKRIEALEAAGRKDVLTGLFSRVEMEGRIAAEIDRQKPFALLMLRIANLPMVQRQFGAAVRADVVSAFAKRMRGGLPESAVIGRWGEEQFLVVVEMEKTEAMALSKKLNQHVAGTYVCMDGGKPQRPALQVSVAVIEQAAEGKYDSLIARLNQV